MEPDYKTTRAMVIKRLEERLANAEGVQLPLVIGYGICAVVLILIVARQIIQGICDVVFSVLSFNRLRLSSLGERLYYRLDGVVLLAWYMHRLVHKINGG